MTITAPAIVLGAGARDSLRCSRCHAGGRRRGATNGRRSFDNRRIGAPNVAGVIALPPLIFLPSLVAATVLEAIVPLPLLAGHALAGRRRARGLWLGLDRYGHVTLCVSAKICRLRGRHRP